MQLGIVLYRIVYVLLSREQVVKQKHSSTLLVAFSIKKWGSIKRALLHFVS
jgi:hypothetical protein